jgi:prevent-host-death family protein
MKVTSVHTDVPRCTFHAMQISVSEARAKLPELLDRVADGEEVTLTRHGAAVAVLVRPDALRARRAAAAFAKAEEIHQALIAARQRPLARRGPLSAEWADERVAGLDRDRDDR